MNAPFQLGLLGCQWTPQGDSRDWLAAYRQLEAEAVLASAMVQAACGRYKAERSPANQASYVTADHAYDAARLRFQLQGAEIVRGVRAIAGIARELQLADQERMI